MPGMRELTSKLVAPELTSVLRQTRFGRLKLALLAEEKRGYEDAVETILEHDPSATFLDLGCGDLRLTRRMARKIGTSNISGVDIWIKYDSEPDIKGYDGDLNEVLPLNDKQFDVVIASNIIEHLWNTDGFMQEIHRVLKPSGYALIVTPNLASWHNIIYLVFGRQPEPASVSDMMDRYEGPSHRRLFTFPGLTKVLKFHGFKIEKAIGAAYHPFPVPVARMFCAVDKHHSSIIVVKIRRNNETLGN